MMGKLMGALAVVVLGLVACGGESELGTDLEGGASSSSTLPPGDEIDETTSSTTTTEATTTTTTEATTTTTEPPPAELTIVEQGFSVVNPQYSDTPRITAAAAIEHSGDEPLTFVEVTFNFTGPDGRPVATETAYIQAIAPDTTAYAIVPGAELRGDALPTKLKVTGSYNEDSFMDATPIRVEVTGVSPAEFGGGHLITGTAKNPSGDNLQFGSVSCALYAAGKIVGGASGVIETLPPNAEVAWEANAFDEIPGVDGAKCSASV